MKQVIANWMPETLPDLSDALEDAARLARQEGAAGRTVYVNLASLSLVRETLSDGSVEFNVVARENN